MQQDALTVFVQYATVNKGFINIEDAARLKCVSKDLHVLFDDTADVLIETTANELGIPYKMQECSHIVKFDVLFQQLLLIRRLYGDRKKSGKFVEVLNRFTHDIAGSIWTESLMGLSKEKQVVTIRFLIDCNVHTNMPNKDIQQNIILVYLMMTFMLKLLNNNKKTIRDKDKSLFANHHFQDVIINKCIALSSTLREEITSYPYMFVDRVIRRVGEVKRLVQLLLN
jgi:hypothetical protein